MGQTLVELHEFQASSNAAALENRASRYGMVVLYGSFVVLGLSAAVVLTVFATSAWVGPVALVLVALLIAVAVLIEYFKDNKIQEWMKRCYWGGVGGVEKYKDLANEMAELEKAVA